MSNNYATTIRLLLGSRGGWSVAHTWCKFTSGLVTVCILNRCITTTIRKVVNFRRAFGSLICGPGEIDSMRTTVQLNQLSSCFFMRILTTVQLNQLISMICLSICTTVQLNQLISLFFEPICTTVQLNQLISLFFQPICTTVQLNQLILIFFKHSCTTV